MKAGQSGAVEGNEQPTVRKRKAIVTPMGERGQEQPLRSDDLRASVAARAYFLYERRGSADGYDLEDWLEAERGVLTK